MAGVDDSLESRRGRLWATVGAKRSNPFHCSSRLRSKLSPPFSGPRKSPTAADICATGLGFGERNVPTNCSPNADLSSELESRPFYSTSFFTSGFSGLASLGSRKVRIPFACRLPRSQQQTGHHDPQASVLDQTLAADLAINEARPTPVGDNFSQKMSGPVVYGVRLPRGRK
jgi:hypothetical protein